ncbi:MAG: NUDIX domain-containing protein [Frisingicoccus sp.]
MESPVSFEETFYENYGLSVRLYEYCKEIKHVFSHRIWHMNVYLGDHGQSENAAEALSGQLYTESEMAELPISTAHRKVCTQIP